MTRVIRTLIADDSALFVSALSELLTGDRNIALVGVAEDGISAVTQTKRLKPDIVIMDVNMPGMDGIRAIEEIMSTAPVPILVLTDDPKSADSRWCFEALSRGALELRRKLDIDEMSGIAGRKLCDDLRFLATVPVVHHARSRRVLPKSLPPMPPGCGLPGVVAIAASTGGPATLAKLLAALPPDFPLQIVIVQHLSGGFTEHLAGWLESSTPLSVEVAKHGMPIKSGSVLVAPDGAHTVIDARGRVELVNNADLAELHCPAADVLFRSLAKHFGPSSIGVVLTGMGRDGADGLLSLRRSGAFTIAQDSVSSVVDGMPRAARENGAAMHSGNLNHIAELLIERATRLRLEPLLRRRL